MTYFISVWFLRENKTCHNIQWINQTIQNFWILNANVSTTFVILRFRKTTLKRKTVHLLFLFFFPFLFYMFHLPVTVTASSVNAISNSRMVRIVNNCFFFFPLFWDCLWNFWRMHALNHLCFMTFFTIQYIWSRKRSYWKNMCNIFLNIKLPENRKSLRWNEYFVCVTVPNSSQRSWCEVWITLLNNTCTYWNSCFLYSSSVL